MKIQFMCDFLAEFARNDITTLERWKLYVDNASNIKKKKKKSGAEIILKGSNNITLEQSLKINFRALNNQAEYEALIAGLKLVREIGAKKL